VLLQATKRIVPKRFGLPSFGWQPVVFKQVCHPIEIELPILLEVSNKSSFSTPSSETLFYGVLLKLIAFF
jgi:hypothetical protein